MNSALPPDQLRNIAMLARSNRLNEAAVLASAAHARHPGDPVLAALAGAIEFHLRRFDRAVPYLEIAHSHHSRDLVVRANLADALAHVGRGADALQLCDDASARADRSLRLARLGGHLAQEAEAFDRAIPLYRHVLAAEPQDWSTWNNLGNALSGARQFAEAAEALQRAAELAPDAAPIRLNLGNALIDAERFDEAETVLHRAAADFPGDAKPLLVLADFYRRSGREDQSFEALSEAAGRAPDDPEILADLGQDAARRTEYALAERSYEAALALRPSLGPAIVGLAALFERTNREAELDPLRERAVANAADVQSIAYTDALRLKRADRFEEALAALDAAGDVVIPHRRHQLRGIMLDRLGDYDEAFAEFTAMNGDRAGEPTRPIEQAQAYREHVIHDRALLTPEWVARWTPDDRERAQRTPAFLVGFPRSGTTLLDTMLMAAPDTLILEEEPFISDIEHALGGVEALAHVSRDQLATMRAEYFAKVASVGPFGPDTLVIDKHPLHLNKVPTIRRLFPDARFILALRHPCDVLLSCFITNFRTNPGMSNFLALDTAAELYDLSFDFWTEARALFDLPVRTVVYERLVSDTDRELRPVFDFLGLPWPGADFDHRTAARERGVVRTASYAQVTEAIYTRSAGRWRRYERHLAPVIARLQPWIERFGYAVEDERFPAWDQAAPAPVTAV
jgi:tetratricopeptide (TPR) repeat protein